MQGLKKFENDQSFLQFCKQYDIIGLCETWQRNTSDFDSFLEGYINLTALRGSGGVTVFAKDNLVHGNIIKRVFDNLTECVVLLLNGEFYESINDIVLIFTYIAPERSPIYTPENDDGISLLNEKLLEIKSVYPNADIIIAGDLNARTKDFLVLFLMMTLTLFLEKRITLVIHLMSLENLKIWTPIINLVCHLLTYVVNTMYTS